MIWLTSPKGGAAVIGVCEEERVRLAADRDSGLRYAIMARSYISPARVKEDARCSSVELRLIV